MKWTKPLIKPRDAVLLPLMKMIYGDRRMFVMNDATSVMEILSCYPALKRPSVVSVLMYCSGLHLETHMTVCSVRARVWTNTWKEQCQGRLHF